MLKLKHLSSCFFFEAMNTYEKKNENLKLDDIFPEFSVQTLLLYSHFIKKEIKAEKKSFEILLESLIFADFIQDKNYEEWVSTQIGDLYRFNKYEKKKIIESISFIPIDVKVKKAIIASWLGRLSFLYEEYFSYCEKLSEKFYNSRIYYSMNYCIYSDMNGLFMRSYHVSELQWPIYIRALSESCCIIYNNYRNDKKYDDFQGLPLKIMIFTPINEDVEKRKRLKKKHIHNSRIAYPSIYDFSRMLHKYDSDYYDIKNKYSYLRYYLATDSKENVIYLRKYYRKK